MVLSEEQAATLGDSNRGTITLEMPPPELIVEVVSQGLPNEEEDYRYKRSEYSARGVTEYWVIDPDESKVTVFTLIAGFYEGVTTRIDRNVQLYFEVVSGWRSLWV